MLTSDPGRVRAGLWAAARGTVGARLATRVAGAAFASGNASLALIPALPGDRDFPADVYLHGERIVEACGFDARPHTQPLALDAARGHRVTCGGNFDPTALRYSDGVFITLVPLP